MTDFAKLRKDGGSFVGTAATMAEYHAWCLQQVCEDCGARFADRAPDAKWATETLCWNCFSRRSARRRGEG